MLNTLLNRLFITSHQCLLCGDLNPQRICQQCKIYFQPPQKPCKRCAIPLPLSGQHHEPICGECLKTPPSYDHVFTPYVYEQPLAKLIQDFKHKGHEHIGRALADLLCESVKTYFEKNFSLFPDRIIAVPLHWRRQWQRGFNQAETFASALRDQLGIKELTKVKRLNNTDSQKGLNREQRLKNLRGSFSVIEALGGKNIAIIDDVMTTGATVNTLAKALKHAGAVQVCVIALARTPKSQDNS